MLHVTCYMSHGRWQMVDGRYQILHVTCKVHVRCYMLHVTCMMYVICYQLSAIMLVVLSSQFSVPRSSPSQQLARQQSVRHASLRITHCFIAHYFIARYSLHNTHYTMTPYTLYLIPYTSVVNQYFMLHAPFSMLLAYYVLRHTYHSSLHAAQLHTSYVTYHLLRLTCGLANLLLIAHYFIARYSLHITHYTITHYTLHHYTITPLHITPYTSHLTPQTPVQAFISTPCPCSLLFTFYVILTTYHFILHLSLITPYLRTCYFAPRAYYFSPIASYFWLLTSYIGHASFIIHPPPSTINPPCDHASIIHHISYVIYTSSLIVHHPSFTRPLSIVFHFSLHASCLMYILNSHFLIPYPLSLMH